MPILVRVDVVLVVLLSLFLVVWTVYGALALCHAIAECRRPADDDSDAPWRESLRPSPEDEA